MALPALPINRPAYTRLPRQLLDVLPRLVPEGPINGDDGNSERWIGGGVTWIPRRCEALFSGDVDACAAFNHNAGFGATFPRVCEPAITQTGFSVFDALRESALEFTFDELEEMLMGQINTKVSAAFATELLSGAISGDKALSRAAHAPTQRAFGSAAPAWLAAAIIEDELARTMRGAAGYLHVPPALLGQLKATYGLTLVGDHWETPLGNTVISDAGYVDAIAPTGQAASGTNADWMYGSGPIVYGMTAPVMADRGIVGSTIDKPNVNAPEVPANRVFTTRDEFTRYADVYGVLVFDPCPVTAVLASYEQTDVV